MGCYVSNDVEIQLGKILVNYGNKCIGNASLPAPAPWINQIVAIVQKLCDNAAKPKRMKTVTGYVNIFKGRHFDVGSILHPSLEEALKRSHHSYYVATVPVTFEVEE